MEGHAAVPAVGKRMWSYVRAAFFMMRKGVLSNKRKLLLLAMHNKALAALLSHHHGSGSAHALRRRDYEYEFSCTNTPADPSSSTSRRRLAYFPCLGAVAARDDHYGGTTLSLPDHASPPLARIDYYAAASSPGLQLLRGLELDLAPGEAAESESDEFACASASPALVPTPGAAGRFSVRVSNYSSEDDEAGGGSDAVDHDAEEFIRRFYDQLRRQNTIAMMLPYMHEYISAA